MHTVPSSFLAFSSHLSSSRRYALIAKLFHRISTISRKIGNHESSLPLCISFFLSLLLSFSFLSRMLFASCSFCYTGGHFLSTRANANVICARDRYTVSFRGRRKKARDERRRDDKERRGKGQRLLMGERASCRDEKDELKCERARAQRRMMIDRSLSRP